MRHCENDILSSTEESETGLMRVQMMTEFKSELNESQFIHKVF